MTICKLLSHLVVDKEEDSPLLDIIFFKANASQYIKRLANLNTYKSAINLYTEMSIQYLFND